MATRIPREFIQEILARVDLVELIEARLTLKRSGNNYTARCPFHNEKTPSFSVRRDKQFYHCFGCGAHGNAIGFLMEFDRLSFIEAVRQLAEQTGLPIPAENESDSAPPTINYQPLLDIQKSAASFYARQFKTHPDARKAVEYLKNRGISGEMAKRFRLGYAPPGWRNLPSAWPEELLITAGLCIQNENKTYDRFRDRIMFPIRNGRGQVIGFGGRVLNDDKPKYINSPETPVFRKHRELYGLYETLEYTRKPARILVVEGYMDVIALAEAGIPEAVATLGTATSEDHFQLLFRYTNELVLCFDGDRAGQQASWKALEAALPYLRDGRQLRFLTIPSGHDPDSLVRAQGPQQFLDLARTAQPFSEYLFAQLTHSLDMQSIESRANLMRSATPLIAKIPEGVFRSLLEQKLAELSGCDPSPQPAPRSPSVTGFSPPQTRRSSKPKPSLMRLFLALLLYKPTLASLLNPTTRRLICAAPKGGSLAQKILSVLEEHPEVSSESLEDIFKGKPEEGFIKELLTWAANNMVADADRLDAEFQGTVHKLEQRITQQRLDALLEQSLHTALSTTEQDELRTLLKN